MRLFFIICAIAFSIVAHASPLNLSAFPKLPHAVRDACWSDTTLHFITESGVYQATLGEKIWNIREITKTGPAETLWSITCQDLLPSPGTEIVVSRVRAGVWRSFVLGAVENDWKILLDEVPFELRQTQWQGESVWVGDARFPQNRGRGEFFLVDTTGSKLRLGKKIKLPHGSVLDNWMALPGGDVAELREHRVEIYTGGPRWKMKQHLPAGGMTTLCAESQPWVMSSIGDMVCRQLAPSVWNNLLLAPRNKLLVDQVIGHVPMIEHGELMVYARDPALDVYQTAVVLGPLSGELAAYFIDKNPVDGRETLFLVVQMRTASEAVGGLTKYSVLIPVTLESLQSK
jgi:hypothetical protein